MAYFNKAFVDFFKGLAANNEREWFHDNKKIYEKEVKKPFYQFVADVIDAMGEREGELGLEVKNAVFRINRDIRFSKDKSPYKLHVGGVVSKGGRKNIQIPGIYIQLSAEENYIGGGSYQPDKQNLIKIREALVEDVKSYRSAVNSKKFKQYFPEGIQGERNKILPKQFKPYAEDIPELFQKQHYCMSKHIGSDFVLKDDLLEVVMQHYEATKDLNDYLKRAIQK